MPTTLPSKQNAEPPPHPRDPGYRDLMVAAALLLGVLGLLCGKYYPPLPGYSLAASSTDLQLSP